MKLRRSLLYTRPANPEVLTFGAPAQTGKEYVVGKIGREERFSHGVIAGKVCV
jgi:hypothetical protein